MKRLFNLVQTFRRYFESDLSFLIFTAIFVAVFVWTMHGHETRLSAGFTLLWGAISMNTPSLVVIFYAVYCVGSGRLNFNYSRDHAQHVLEILGRSDQVSIDKLQRRNKDDGASLVDQDFEIEEV